MIKHMFLLLGLSAFLFTACQSSNEEEEAKDSPAGNRTLVAGENEFFLPVAPPDGAVFESEMTEAYAKFLSQPVFDQLVQRSGGVTEFHCFWLGADNYYCFGVDKPMDMVVNYFIEQLPDVEPLRDRDHLMMSREEMQALSRLTNQPWEGEFLQRYMQAADVYSKQKASVATFHYEHDGKSIHIDVSYPCVNLSTMEKRNATLIVYSIGSDTKH